jgi:endonuclease I
VNFYLFRKYFFLLFLPFALFAQGTYYNSINSATSSFITDLESRIRSPYTHVSYAQYDETNVAFFASRDTTGGQKVVTCVYSGQNYVYSGTFAWTTFSREHTFCHSWMPTNPADSPERDEYSDQHHLFPTNQNNANAVRSNHPLGIVANISSQYLNSKFGTNSSGQTVFEPRDSHKGDAARAILYMCLRYDGIGGYVWNFNNLNNTILPGQPQPEAPQNLQTLLDWHKQDPPSKWEVDRNNYIQSIQGNRNPFSDHPEYVNYINFNDLTKLNPSYSIEPSNQPTGISISSITNSSFTVSWTSALSGSQSPSGYLIEIYNSNDYFIPIDGSTYADDTNISDSKGLVNVSAATTSYTFSGLSAGTTYYIRLHSFNGSGSSINYKIDGTVLSATAVTTGGVVPILADEPTNYPKGFSSFSPMITDTSITVKWADTNGTVLASGYILIANTSNSFSDPVDGVVYPDDINLADGSAMVNIAYSAADTFRFGGLTPATTYSFRIYPYNGNGIQRNYKTSNFPILTLYIQYGTSAGTVVNQPSVVVNEYFNAAAKTSEWVELMVIQNNLDMRGMKVQDYSSAGNVQSGAAISFTNNAMWSQVARGTFIVILGNGNTQSEDTDISDKLVIIRNNNAAYFSGGLGFDISGTADAIEILSAGGTHIHSLSNGNRPGAIASIASPTSNYASTLLSGISSSVRFTNVSSIGDFSSDAKTTNSAIGTQGLPNDAAQTTFVDTQLPVDLVSFSAVVKNSAVILDWSTATEVYNYGFEIERCTASDRHFQGDGHFAWSNIGFIEGNGTTNVRKEYLFTDKIVDPGEYSYRLKQIDRDGKFEYSREVEVVISPIPQMFTLMQNYPNPFNPTTLIRYQLPTNGFTTLKVYDVIGREVATLVNEVKEAGYFSATFDAKNLVSGIYIAKLQSGEKVQLKKMLTTASRIFVAVLFFQTPSRFTIIFYRKNKTG